MTYRILLAIVATVIAIAGIVTSSGRSEAHNVLNQTQRTAVTPTPTPHIQFTSDNVNEDEGETASIGLTRNGDVSGTETVNVATGGGTATGCADPAPGCDFQSVNTSVTFMPGETQATVNVPVFPDFPAVSESTTIPESVQVAGTLFGGPGDPSAVQAQISTQLTIHDAAAEYRDQQAVNIPAGGVADVYPSTITVAGESGPIRTVRVTLFHLSHSFPEHLDVLLVGPGGQKYILMSDSGGSNAISPTSPVSFTFEDMAGKVLPDSASLTWDAFEPTSRRTPITSLPAPAPAAPYSEPGSAVGGTGTQTLDGRFAGTDPNGVWSLYVRDNGGTPSAQTVAGTFGGWGIEFNQSFQPRINDLDGDGRTDISVWRPSDGTWYWLDSSNQTFNTFQFGASGDQIVPGDYDGDGKTDFAVFRAGTWFISDSTAGFTATQFGLATDLPAQGDFDGDGKTDIAVFRPSSGVWYVQGSTAGFSATQFGQNGDKPVVGDYDGDGEADIAVYRPSNGVWYELRSSSGFAAAQFGASNDKVVPGDYDGDGKTDLAIFRPGDLTWYIARPTGIPAQNFDAFRFGAAGDVPVPGDYDGDGKTDIGVYRPSIGTWYMQRTASGFAAQQFGTANDKPVPAAYVPLQ